MGVALLQRFDAGLDDVGRRVEVGLADLEVNDALALASSALARTRTSKAVSVPSRDIRLARRNSDCVAGIGKLMDYTSGANTLL